MVRSCSEQPITPQNPQKKTPSEPRKNNMRIWSLLVCLWSISTWIVDPCLYRLTVSEWIPVHRIHGKSFKSFRTNSNRSTVKNGCSLILLLSSGPINKRFKKRRRQVCPRWRHPHPLHRRQVALQTGGVIYSYQHSYWVNIIYACSWKCEGLGGK